MSSSNFRKDIVSGDWILIAPSIKKKPNFFGKSSKRPNAPQGSCPFEDPQKAGHGKPIYWLSKAGAGEKDPASWFVQAIPNKFPVLTEQKACPVVLSEGPYKTMKGVGFQEIVITRDHERSLGFMNNDEISLVVKTYIERYKALKKEKCVEYILIFHNNGPTAGASVGHPHSQIFALPIVPTDVSRSLAGSEKYFSKHKICVHCAVIKKELKDAKRVIYENKNFVVLCPYASKVSFEIRLFPKLHSPNFERLRGEESEEFVDALFATFSKLKNAMNDPDYNFFIHTSPVKGTGHYHWHMEILPRTSIWAGFELGTGIEILKVLPEDAARILKNAKI